jgi:hypothetical protein
MELDGSDRLAGAAKALAIGLGFHPVAAATFTAADVQRAARIAPPEGRLGFH